MSNILGEAMRWMSEPELPTSGDLREQIVNVVMFSVHDADVDLDALVPIVSGLVDTYEALRTYDGLAKRDDFELRYVEADEAWRIMGDTYAKACASVVQRDFPHYDAESAIEGFEWPHVIAHAGTRHTPALVRAIGLALGYYDGRRTAEGFKYYAAQEQAAQRATATEDAPC